MIRSVIRSVIRFVIRSVIRFVIRSHPVQNSSTPLDMEGFPSKLWNQVLQIYSLLSKDLVFVKKNVDCYTCSLAILKLAFCKVSYCRLNI